ncbi:iron uptake transporter deferrochelatase/peroxidase subunit [uncultured Corynebacterium sp.]|uniref:iron uptake transporter deferrochelatase/peroxidase subunit n=1 Tax=uncultured Corynebacterium sp. TaxID=159447 RepID=UPI0025DF7DF2|nr:iron uptake transporter deferrochelatase/peroxidase subunit [uncultured Corynebacterium sp.]
MTRGSVSRRGFLTGLGLTGLGAAAAGTVGAGALAACSSGDGDTQIVPFRGEHQAGVTTAQQEHLHIVAFSVLTGDRGELREMLSTWTAMAERMTQGKQTTDGGALTDVDADANEDPDNTLNLVPDDTGEALDLSSGNLTVTVGFGPSLFDKRFGLADRRPKELESLPKFPGDQLQDALCDGDIVIQACADDPQVAVHAVRNLTRAGTGVVEVKWSQLGYGAASKTTKEEDTPRNLFGFKDGTRNITADETDDVAKMVWVSDDRADSAGPDNWMAGGSYMCVRRIRMLLEVWDRQILDDQQHTFARYKGSGAPIGTKHENDDVPFDLYLGTGGPAIPTDSHVFLAHPDQNDGQRMLRRAYNFIEGTDSMGHLSAGLFFIAYVAAPSENFTPIQMKLAHSDKMNEYVRYESKAIFACPPGLADGQDWGTALFGDV